MEGTVKSAKGKPLILGHGIKNENFLPEIIRFGTRKKEISMIE